MKITKAAVSQSQEMPCLSSLKITSVFFFVNLRIFRDAGDAVRKYIRKQKVCLSPSFCMVVSNSNANLTKLKASNTFVALWFQTFFQHFSNFYFILSLRQHITLSPIKCSTAYFRYFSAYSANQNLWFFFIYEKCVCVNITIFFFFVASR